MYVASSGNFTLNKSIQPISPQPDFRSDLSDILTPEQKNTVQKDVDDKIAEQMANVKSNYQTAKDIDLMHAYYQQQQKLFDVYLQTSTGDNSTTNSTQNSSTISALTNAYAELYELHQNVKDGVSSLPGIKTDQEGLEVLPVNTLLNSSSNIGGSSANSLGSVLSQKQVDAYNSLMMPSTTSYVHLSA